MPDRKSFLLRIDPQILKSLQKWADDDLRSLNGQIEFLLRRLLVEEGRLKASSGKGRATKEDERGTSSG
jgi:hypothetical protein